MDFEPAVFRGIQMAKRLSNLIGDNPAGRACFAGLVFILFFIGTICFVNALGWINKPFPGFLINQRMVINGMGQYYWSGTRAGLKHPDKVLAANGQPLHTSQDLERVVMSTPVGDPIRYTVERDGSVVEMAIPTMRFTPADFVVLVGTLYMAGLLYLILGIVVFVLKPDTPVSWSHFLLCFGLSAFNLTSFDVAATHAGMVRWYFIFSALMPAAGVHLSMLFPQPRSFVLRRPWLQATPYIVAAAILVPMELFYPGPKFLLAYNFVYIYMIVGSLLFLGSSLASYLWQSSVIAKQRSKVLLFGAALAFPLPAFSQLAFYRGWTFQGIPVQTNFLALPLLVFPAAIAYAIAKHNLFDVDVYIKRTVGYVLMTVIVAMAYFTMQTVLSTVVLKPILGENAEKVYPIVFALLVVFLFNPVNRKVQESVDKMFFRKKFDYKGAVTAASNALSSILNLNEIILQVILTVRKEIFIDAAGVILFEPQKKGCQSYFIEDGPGQVKDQSKEVCILYDDPLLALISREKRLITKYDIAEDPRYSNVKESCGQRFAEMAASLAVPLIYQDEVKGVLALGYKKSGHFYSREDIDLLSTLASQAAVAIENAKMAEQMKKEETVRTNLARYLSPQIVDQIIQKDVKVNLGGDRKVVTVLFSDIRNFTTITESRPPDQLVQILNEYFTEMAGVIFENQGSLDKYIGDAIVAVFGSLIPLENSATYAVTAAIEMMKRLPVLNERWMNEYGFTMNIGIGINTGEVFLGNIGSPERMEFTVIGDTVNVASRFSGLAKPGQILMTRETLAYLGSDINYKELPPTEVKGKTGKLNVFEIIYA
jgi:class 3 adenylate cyclase